MIKLWDSSDEIHREFINYDLAYQFIAKYLQDKHFKSYYYRVNQVDEKTIQIDYGSHTHFFYMKSEKENIL